jgi:hypothetical protein
MKQGILALNIVDASLEGYQILNTRGPLLFYYNNEDYESKIDMMKNKDFMDYLEKHNVLTNLNSYFNTYVVCVTLDDINDDSFSEQRISIRDIFPFTEENYITFPIVAKEVLRNLHYKIHNTPINDEQLNNIKETYHKLYTDAMSFVNIETFNLYIRGYLQETYPQLTQQDLNNFINYVKSL